MPDVTCAAIIDLSDAAELSRRVDDLSTRVDELWRRAMEAGNFVEVDRCTAASQALHRAALALRDPVRIGL